MLQYFRWLYLSLSLILTLSGCRCAFLSPFSLARARLILITTTRSVWEKNQFSVTAKKTGSLCHTNTQRETNTHTHTPAHSLTLAHPHTHSHSHLQSHFAIVNTLNCATWADPRIRLSLPAASYLLSPPSPWKGVFHAHTPSGSAMCVVF